MSTAQYNANNQRTDQTYDANGNLQSLQPSISLTYDAENRQAHGWRLFVYVRWQWQAGHENRRRGDEHLCLRCGGAIGGGIFDGGEYVAECVTCYLSYDHLGTVRMVTDAQRQGDFAA